VVYVISIILSRGRERGAKSERRCFRVRSFAESVPIRMNRYACLLNTSESYEAKTENQLVVVELYACQTSLRWNLY
jgi:hypothetical protein